MGFELAALIKSIGYIGIWTILFAESGILFGVLLPGDTLLFTIGVLARQGYFNFWVMLAGCFVSAFVGNLVGYELGKRYGLPFARKYANRFISEEQLDKTNYFFSKHGVVTIVLARFLPIMRTIAPFLAGVIRMEYRIFVIYSAVGAFFWACGLPLAGYYLGQFIPDEWIDMMLIPIGLIIVAIIAWPYALKFFKSKKK